jgi:hypothetical protein
MADEFDRQIMPGLLQAAFSVSLGACYKGWEMMSAPQESLPKVMAEMQELFSIPPEAPESLQGKAEAVAGVWMCKGIDLMQTCKNAGEKFTEAK